MALAPGIVLDMSQYDATLKQYIKLTSKTVAEAANSIGYYVARNAVITTIRADRKKIESSLGRYVVVTGPNKKGIVKGRRQMTFAKSNNKTGATRAFLIIAGRRARAGLAPISGAEMRTAAKKMIMSRIRSINFVRSGWLPAIKKLAKYVKVSRLGVGANADNSAFQTIENAVKVRGVPKGDAKPAYPSETLLTGTSVIANSVGGGRGNSGIKGRNSAFVQNEKINGLKEAIAREVQSKMSYIQNKAQQDANKVSVKTTGTFSI